MKSGLSKLLFILVIVTQCLYASILKADDKINIQNIAKQVDQVNRKIQRKKFSEDDLAKWTKLTIKLSNAATLCIDTKKDELRKLEESISGLGKKVAGEKPSVTASRKKLQKEKHKVEKEIAECNVYLLKSETTTDNLDKAKTIYVKGKYFVREPHVGILIRDFIRDPTGLFSESSDFIWRHMGVDSIPSSDWVAALIAAIILLVAAFQLRRLMTDFEKRHKWNDDPDNLFMRGFLTTFARYLPWLLLSTFFFIFIYYETSDHKKLTFIAQFSFALVSYMISVFVVSLLISPTPPAKPFLYFMGDTAVHLAQKIKALLFLALIGYLAFYTSFSESINYTNLLLLRYGFSLVLVVYLVWTVSAIVKSPKLPRLRWLGILVNLSLILTSITELSGYEFLSHELRRAVLISFLAIIVAFTISKLLQNLFNSLESGSHRLAKPLKKTLSVTEEERIPGLIWIRFISTITIWGGLVLFFISIWDFRGGFLEQVEGYLINGFQIGDFRVVPGRFIWALVLFSAVVMLTGWLKSQMEHRWLAMTTMGSGARDALVTISGYVLYLFAGLAALAAAGFDFGKIAIIAGALSVGIGFGLQNIVNNFVSGLILLFERPIRKGDWVVVGTTEGYVKNIQIRSTLIRTFDNSDVIVPNSELISSQVTNWMLSSKNGRAIIPVGVAYGSDTEKVKEILLSIAEDNQKIIHNDSSLAPYVLFRGFGDSSLDFELRVFLKQIDSRLSVISEINFAIDKAFREAGIEIPFPQRDVHVRTLPAEQL